MPSSLRPAALIQYLAGAAIVLTIFAKALKPVLLNTPPNAVLMPLVVFVVAGVLYVLGAGPFWVLERTGPARLFIRRQLTTTTVVLASTAALFLATPFVPYAATLASSSLAGASLLLRTVAGDEKGHRHRVHEVAG